MDERKDVLYQVDINYPFDLKVVNNRDKKFCCYFEKENEAKHYKRLCKLVKLLDEIIEDIEKECQIRTKKINSSNIKKRKINYTMKTIEVSEEIYEKIKDQLTGNEAVDINSYADFVGKKLFIRTVTYHCIGEVVKIVGSFFYLKESCWVADSGRFMNALEDGELSEVEPTGHMWVNINAIVDMFVWKHKLPSKQK